MFAIHVTQYYYAGTLNAPRSGYLRDDNGNVETFSSHESASNYVRLLEPKENYRLQHGEYSPPSFRVRKYSR
jgi:hypothetical protein